MRIATTPIDDRVTAAAAEPADSGLDPVVDGVGAVFQRLRPFVLIERLPLVGIHAPPPLYRVIGTPPCRAPLPAVDGT